MNLLEIINNQIITKSGKVNSNFFRNDKNDHIKNEIITQTHFLPEDTTLPERIYCLKNSINSLPVCPCNNTNKLNFINFKFGYFETCSKSCTIKTASRVSKMLERINRREDKHCQRKEKTNLC